MLEEYDFTGCVRGKYAKRYAGGTNVVVIDPDVAEYFPDHDSVNDALRGLTAIIKRQRITEQSQHEERSYSFRVEHEPKGAKSPEGNKPTGDDD